MSEQPAAATTPARALTPNVLAWLGALTAAVVPLVQFINGYWQNQLKQTEIAHQIALDFAKLAIADKASREYRRDTLTVIASIEGNPLQTWARTELQARRGEQQTVMEALRSRLEGRRYTTLVECKAYLEQQLKVQSYLVAETFDRKDMKDTLGAAIKDDYTTSVERDCRDLETGTRAAIVVAIAPPDKLSTTKTQGTATPASAEERVCASGNGNPLDKLTVAKLARIYPRARPADLETYLPLLRKGMAKAEINTCSRAAMFLAQLGRESDELRFTQELSSGAAYEGRADLGNTQAGDGARFKGRGLLLLTGRNNYQRFAEALGRPELMSTPELVASDPELALETALQFWSHAKLNTYSDSDDIRMVTRRINGGYNGLDQRSAYLAAARAVL